MQVLPYPGPQPATDAADITLSEGKDGGAMTSTAVATAAETGVQLSGSTVELTAGEVYRMCCRSNHEVDAAKLAPCKHC